MTLETALENSWQSSSATMDALHGEEFLHH